MSRKFRDIFLYDSYYLIANEGNNLKRIFRDKEDKDYFRRKIFEYARKENVEISLICISDSCFQLIIVPRKYSNVPKMMQRLETGYAMRFNKKYLHIGHVFKNRYSSFLIENNIEVLDCIEMISNILVEEGLSNDRENYAWFWISDNLRTDLVENSPKGSFTKSY